MREAEYSPSRPYVWALAVFTVALFAAYLLAEAIAIGLGVGAFAMGIIGAACVLWLIYLRREIDR
jgi:uncharacterized membrane protein